MTDITERIARALHAKEWSGQPRPEPFHLSKGYWIASAEAALQALTDSGIPIDKLISGEYVAVPVEPTEAMDEAGLDDPEAGYCDRCMQSGHTRNSGWPTIIWQAMLTAHKE